MSEPRTRTEPRTSSPLAGGATSRGSDRPPTPADQVTEHDRAVMHERVAKVIAVIRPAIQADNGDIELRDVDSDTGVVTVELLGACITCPVSTGTLKDGVERILKQRVAGVTAVEHLGEALHGIETGTAVSL